MKVYFSGLVAIALAAVCFGIAKFPSWSAPDPASLARFNFKKFSLPEVAEQPPHKFVRQVHPNLERIAAWVS